MALSTAWVLILAPVVNNSGDALRVFVAVVSATLFAVLTATYLRLYRARVCSIRSVEVRRLGRVSFLTAVAVFFVTSAVGLHLSAARLFFGSLLALCALVFSRCFYSAWVRAWRNEGRYVRPVVLVGHNEEGRELERLVTGHPDLGFAVVAVAHTAQQVEPLLAAHDATGVIIAVSALGQRELNQLVRTLLRKHVHVVVSNGLLGIDHQRLRPQPFAREPLFYLEPASVSLGTATLKRVIDITGALIGLVVCLPLLIVAAVAIKLQDGGPIFFRQERIGRRGRPFTVYKLRSMRPNADVDRARLQALNQRNGPIFKLDDDPRVTPVGRLLRAASIDELPQLVNVLFGTMSLVGPRPATPAEVAQFDDELLARHVVRPGMTGLWQVEARGNPSFSSYRRLDLFYIENLSVRLDLLILLDTIMAVLTEAIRSWGLNSKRGLNSKETVPMPDRAVEDRIVVGAMNGHLRHASTVPE